MATQGPRVDLAWTREKAHVTKWQLTAVPGSVLSTQLRSSLSVSFFFLFFFLSVDNLGVWNVPRDAVLQSKPRL